MLGANWLRRRGTRRVFTSAFGPSLRLRLPRDARANAHAHADTDAHAHACAYVAADACADAHARADVAVDACANAHAFTLANARADERRAGRGAVGCVSTLEHPLVPPSTIEYPVYYLEYSTLITVAPSSARVLENPRGRLSAMECTMY
jgi:hypothetical protein